MAMPMYRLIELADKHHQLDHYGESSQHVSQNDAMVRISDFELDSWNFAGL
jgi:hypothetical protein